MTDSIADMLTRIRNASRVGKVKVLIPHSKLKLELAKILKEEKYIADYKEVENKFKEIEVKLKYENGNSVINSIKRVSKPGQRIYYNSQELPRVLNGYGISVVSTSQGIMTNKQARKNKIGGEVLFEIY